MTDTDRLEHLLDHLFFDRQVGPMGPMYRLYGQSRFYESKRAALDALILSRFVSRLP